jgi:exodeoxyribonuclease VII large subunit
MTEPRSPNRDGPAWSVSALLLAVSDSLSARFGAVTVRGELSGFSRAGSGHCYFSLKDGAGAPGLIRCAMFRRAASLLEFLPADGQSVELRGRVSLYEPRGELQLVVESLQRLGAGSLYEEFLRLRARLAAQGLFDESRRRPLPRHPRCVGVITSPDAAAWRDVMTTLSRRSPQVRVLLYPSLVQGPQAPGELVAALVTAAQRREVDVLLLVRGGGSLEDLWAFNDERVVRAVAASPIPLICGVGHETDVTLSDLAADLRAATPTAAAEQAAPARDELQEAQQQLALRLQRALRRSLDRQAQRLDLLAHRAGLPAARLAGEMQRLDSLRKRLQAAVGRRLLQPAQQLPPLQARMHGSLRVAAQRQSDRLLALGARLRAAHPQHVLERGFAWVLDEQGRPVMRAAGVTAGQELQAVFADGRVQAQVLRVAPGGPTATAAAPHEGAAGKGPVPPAPGASDAKGASS